MKNNAISAPNIFLTEPEIDLLIEKAAASFETYKRITVEKRIAFLTQIAAEIAEMKKALVEKAEAETALPAGRLQGEVDRTINQINLFVNLLKEGSWVKAVIDIADPERSPLPKPDIRQIQVPLGLVCVYGASNFPFAFSVAGGDTISALASGCPVLYKIHLAHPETSLLVSQCISRAIEKTGMPAGVFVPVLIDKNEIGIHIVSHPAIKAVAFTGSYTGGKALYDAAARRKSPIPVYAEMGSINPVFILPARLKRLAKETAAALASSNVLGAGQFCTNPGVIIMLKSPGATAFETEFGQLLALQDSHSMLTASIFGAYQGAIQTLASLPELRPVGHGKDSGRPNAAIPAAFSVEGHRFLQNKTLSEEYFGPVSIHVLAESREQLMQIAEELEGQLTASIWCEEEDIGDFGNLFSLLETKAGRLLINNAPTGVEVGHAMVHGGPFPATTDSRTTSVGSSAIYRFTRPISLQNYPEKLLPEALANQNKRGIWRTVNGILTKDDIVGDKNSLI